MSTATTVTDERFVALALSLLVEYTRKMKEISHYTNFLKRGGWEPDAQRFKDIDHARVYFRRLQPELRSLIETVSQRLEHGDLDPLDRINLKLKLSEFEYELEAAERSL